MAEIAWSDPAAASLQPTLTFLEKQTEFHVRDQQSKLVTNMAEIKKKEKKRIPFFW